MHHTKVILYAFIKREGRRLRMLWGLLGIQHKVYSVSLHRLGEHLHSDMHSKGSFHLQDSSTGAPSSGSAPTSRPSLLYMVHLAYLDEMHNADV